MLVTWPGLARAQARVTLTVEEAVARAIETSPRVAESAARADAARFAAAGRDAATRPQLALVGGYTRTNHVDEFGVPQPDGRLRVIFPDVPDNYRARVDLQWSVYAGGRLEALADAGRAEHEAAARDLTTTRSDLRLEATRAYWALVTARETERVVQEALGRVETHVRDLRSRLETGLIPPNEVLSAQAQRARQHVLLIEARNAREVAAADLRRLTGLPPAAELELTSPYDMSATGGREVPLDDLIAAARKARPERQALERRVAAAAARRAAAAASLRPGVSLAAGWDYARPNPRILPRVDQWHDSWDLTVNVGWSLWDGGRASAERGEADALERAARARLAEFDRLLELELRQRRLDLDAARASVGAATEGVRSAAEARRVVGERFAVGVATSADVVDAQVALLQAELDRTRALASVRIAEARLERAVGDSYEFQKNGV
jgi:outer membrane protein TolC